MRITLPSIGDREAIDAAINYFKKAVELDPTYALAYAELGEAYMWMANFNDPDNPSWVGLAQQALSQAESLDPQLAEIHAARFQYYFSKYTGIGILRKRPVKPGKLWLLNPGAGHGSLGTIYDHLGLDQRPPVYEKTSGIWRWIHQLLHFKGRLVESLRVVPESSMRLSRRIFISSTHLPQFSLTRHRQASMRRRP